MGDLKREKEDHIAKPMKNSRASIVDLKRHSPNIVDFPSLSILRY